MEFPLCSAGWPTRLGLRRGNIGSLALTGKTVRVNRDLTDVPGRDAYSALAHQPRYDDKIHSLVTGVISATGGRVESTNPTVDIATVHHGKDGSLPT